MRAVWNSSTSDPDTATNPGSGPDSNGAARVNRSDSRKVAVCVVIYNHLPDFESLEAAMRNSTWVVLIDNGSRPDIQRELERFAAKSPDKVLLIENGSNFGLSKAYNHALKELQRRGVYWVYFLDHDAHFEDELFHETRRAWAELEGQGIRVGIVAPLVTDDPRLFSKSINLRRAYVDLQSTLTSGILTNVRVFDQVGGFDERLFVEAADLDFTSRVARHGYQVCMVNRCLIVQQFGLPPDQSQATVRWGNSWMRFRSLVRVAIGNSNMFRTRLFYYPAPRQARLIQTLKWIAKQGYPWANQARFTRFWASLEDLYVRRFAGVQEPIGVLERSPEPTDGAIVADILPAPVNSDRGFSLDRGFRVGKGGSRPAAIGRTSLASDPAPRPEPGLPAQP
jgi:GT2 family glycosyltransferase